MPTLVSGDTTAEWRRAGSLGSDPWVWTPAQLLTRSVNTGGLLNPLCCSLLICKRETTVQFSHSVVSNSLWPHEPQHTRPPYPLWIPGVHPNHWVDSNAHWVGDAIQPSHPLSSPSSPALNLSQHQGLFQWVSSSHQVAKVLEFQLQHRSFQWTTRTDLL